MTLDEFDDTFNFAFNIQNGDFDWFDNPYISPNVYFLDENYAPTIHKKVKLKKCQISDLTTFMT
jgi:hypothetical protein